MTATVLADLMPETPTFLDDLTPDSGLGLRRWSRDEYRRMAYPVIFGPEERTELIGGEVMVWGEGIPRLFSRYDYYRLAKYGILKPNERTELIYGRIIKRMSPMAPPHTSSLIKAASALQAAFGEGYVVRQQMPIRLSTGLEPEPDILVVLGQVDDYTEHPTPVDALLLIEVSDSTLRYDRHSKATMYAADNIADYWLLNLRRRTLEVRRQPENGEYLDLQVYSETEGIAPLAASTSPVRVAAMLPVLRP